MSDDLAPFRPMPKFLCIKLIIFASYWQGLFLSILQFLGAIPNDVPGYTADNLAAAIQDAVICFEMPLFAIGHWYAFSWHDYADVTISSARMPVKFALRDAFGIRDLIEDTKETWRGKQYDYRTYDSGDRIIAHEESHARVARMMEGMRYEQGGKGKYWLPKSGKADDRTPLLGKTDRERSPNSGTHSPAHEYRAADPDWEIAIDAEDERLYDNARALEFGDWNYPVITAHFATRDDWMNRDPGLLTTSANRHLFQPTKDHKRRRKSELKKRIHKGKTRSSSRSDGEEEDGLEAKLHRDLSSSPSKSSKIDESQLVDLVIEDEEAEQMERVRARKEGGDKWNNQEQKHFIRTYSIDSQHSGDSIRQGYDPDKVSPDQALPEHAVNDDEAEQDRAESSRGPGKGVADESYGDLDDRHVWDE